MKPYILSLLSMFAVLALTGCGASPLVQNDQNINSDTKRFFDQKSIFIHVEDGREDVKVVMPKIVDTRHDWPLIILLHGYGASGDLQDLYFDASGHAAELGFIIALPNGTKNKLGDRFWNAFDSCCDFENTQVDDVKFLTSLVRKIKDQVGIDENRVTFFGHSNGGYMSYKMACSSTETIAGVAVLAGSMSGDFNELCATAPPTSVLHVHGTADETVLYNGGVIEFSKKSYQSASDVVGNWSKHNACQSHSMAIANVFDFVLRFQLPGFDTNSESWSQCLGKTTVELLSIEGGDHKPMFGLGGGDFSKHALNFLLNARHEKQSGDVR